MVILTIAEIIAITLPSLQKVKSEEYDDETNKQNKNVINESM